MLSILSYRINIIEYNREFSFYFFFKYLVGYDLILNKSLLMQLVS